MLKAYYNFMVFDSDKKNIRRSRCKKSRSFLKGFAHLLCRQFTLTNQTIYDITNTARTINTSYMCCACPGRNHNASLQDPSTTELLSEEVGIIVGTGSNPVTINDYALQTRINHGTGAGELIYLSSSGYNFTENTGTNVTTFDLVRLFLNSSGDTISISEVGIYCSGSYSSTYLYQYPFCILRDVVSPSQDVGDGEYLKVTYTLQIAS